MCDDVYAYRIRITRNYSEIDVQFDTLTSALPIHISARLDDSMTPHSAVHGADQLFALLTKALGHENATKVLEEAMTRQPVERNLGTLVSADLRRQLSASPRASYSDASKNKVSPNPDRAGSPVPILSRGGS